MTGPVKKNHGAPKGNKNALKHGFYARFHTREENQQLHGMQGSVRDEIDNLRVMAQRLNLQLNDCPDQDILLKTIRTLVKLFDSIGSLEKVEAFLTGKANDSDQAIQEAIDSLKEKWDLS